MAARASRWRLHAILGFRCGGDVSAGPESGELAVLQRRFAPTSNSPTACSVLKIQEGWSGDSPNSMLDRRARGRGREEHCCVWGRRTFQQRCTVSGSSTVKASLAAQAQTVQCSSVPRTYHPHTHSQEPTAGLCMWQPASHLPRLWFVGFGEPFSITIKSAPRS